MPRRPLRRTGIRRWPLGFDIRSFAMAMLGGGYKDHIEETLPRRWFDEGLPHTHRSLDDAIEQGALFCNMLIENHGRRGKAT